MSNAQELFQQRTNRIAAARAIQEADRVPIIPKMNFFYSSAYGISAYEVMSDQRNVLPGLRQYLTEFSPDAVWGPAQYPLHVMEALGANFIHWPGYVHNIPRDDSFQIVDDTYLEPEEFEEFAEDPSNFIITKWLPRRCDRLKGLSKISFKNLTEFGIISGMAAFDDPEVKEAFEAMVQAGRHGKVWMEGCGLFAKTCIDMGFPLGPFVGQNCAFDMFADNYRGMIPAICDIKERPDEVLAILEKLTEISIKLGLSSVKAQGLEYLFIPLHNGVDEFMSCADYEKFYWPGLKALMLAAIEEGITPYVFCEGRYNTRLDIIKDVPKGKVVYMFENVDMAEVKKKVGDVACITGNLDTSTLIFGSKEKTIEETKRLLDTCAPGGGFIMDLSIVMDNCKKENLEAVFETVETYGRY